MGSGTTAVAASEVGRNWVGYEVSEKYLKIASERLWDPQWHLFDQTEFGSVSEREVNEQLKET